MPDLQVTVVYGRRRQSYMLHGATLTIGRSPDAHLRLSLPFVAPVHAVLDDIPGGYRIRPGSAEARLRLGGETVPLDGVDVPDGKTADIVLESPDGSQALELHLQPQARAVVGRPEAAAPLPEVAAPLPAASAGLAEAAANVRHTGGGTGRHDLRARPGRLSVVLIGVVVLTSLAIVLALTAWQPREAARATRVDSSTATLSTDPTDVARWPDLPMPPARSVSSADDTDLAGAARAFLTGELDLARQILHRVALAKPDDPVTLALELATRREIERREMARTADLVPFGPRRVAPADTPADLPRQSPGSDGSAPAAEPAMPEPAPGLPEATPALPEATPALPEPTPAEVDELRRQLRELESLIAAGDGAAVRAHPLVRAAWVELQARLRRELAVREETALVFPELLRDETLSVQLDGGVLTLRGFVDQWNQAGQLLRLKFLVRLRPLSPTRFEHLGTSLLR